MISENAGLVPAVDSNNRCLAKTKHAACWVNDCVLVCPNTLLMRFKNAKRHSSGNVSNRMTLARAAKIARANGLLSLAGVSNSSRKSRENASRNSGQSFMMSSTAVASRGSSSLKNLCGYWRICSEIKVWTPPPFRASPANARVASSRVGSGTAPHC